VIKSVKDSSELLTLIYLIVINQERFIDLIHNATDGSHQFTQKFENQQDLPLTFWSRLSCSTKNLCPFTQNTP
jgi:hypothetical protein